MEGCQNYGPFLGTLNIRCRIIIGIPFTLTTSHMSSMLLRNTKNQIEHKMQAGMIQGYVVFSFWCTSI